MQPKVYGHIDTLPYISFNNVPFMKIMEKAGRVDQVVILRGGERIQAGEYLFEVIPTRAIPGATSASTTGKGASSFPEIRSFQQRHGKHSL